MGLSDVASRSKALGNESACFECSLMLSDCLFLLDHYRPTITVLVAIYVALDLRCCFTPVKVHIHLDLCWPTRPIRAQVPIS